MSKFLSDTANPRTIIMYIGLLAAFLLTFYPVLQQLVMVWYKSDDYSHGFVIVPISFYFAMRKRREIASLPRSSGHGGSILIGLILCVYVFGFFAEIVTLTYFAMVGTLWALVWFLFGPSVFRKLLFPLFLLLFMIPVPAQLYSMATLPLQLFVSKISAFAASLLKIPILREGNILHLPDHTLAVVQACSGLRSIFSLLTLSTIFGYLTLRSNLLRVILIACGVPAAIIVNIIRVLLMLVALYFFDFDLSTGAKHTFFSALIFLMALIIIACFKEILSKWD